MFMERRDSNLHLFLIESEIMRMDEGLRDMIIGTYGNIKSLLMGSSPDQMLDKVRDNSKKMQDKTYWDGLSEMDAESVRQENVMLLDKIMSKASPEWLKKNGMKQKEGIVRASGLSLDNYIKVAKRAILAGVAITSLSLMLAGGSDTRQNDTSSNNSSGSPVQVDPGSGDGGGGGGGGDGGDGGGYGPSVGGDGDGLSTGGVYPTPVRDRLFGPKDGGRKTPLRNAVFGRR